MLINAGLYREKHLVEPAMATLILGSLNRNSLWSSHSYSPCFEKVLAWDMNNGVCGLLQAIQVVDGFLQSGDIKHGLIVAGDSAQKTGEKQHYSIRAGAAAILLSKQPGSTGFSAIMTESYPDYAGDFKGVSYHQQGKLHLSLRTHDSFAEHALHCVSESIEKFLHHEKMKTEDIDLICCSQMPEGLTKSLAERFEMGDRVIGIDKPAQKFYTAAPLMALHSHFYKPSYQLARKILFVTVGSGISTSIALYNK